MAQSDELQPLPTPEAFIDQFAFSLLYVLLSVIGFHAQCLERLVCSQFGSKVLPDSADAAVNAFCLTSCLGSDPPTQICFSPNSDWMFVYILSLLTCSTILDFWSRI